MSWRVRDACVNVLVEDVDEEVVRDGREGGGGGGMEGRVA